MHSIRPSIDPSVTNCGFLALEVAASPLPPARPPSSHLLFSSLLIFSLSSCKMKVFLWHRHTQSRVFWLLLLNQLFYFALFFFLLSNKLIKQRNRRRWFQSSRNIKTANIKHRVCVELNPSRLTAIGRNPMKRLLDERVNSKNENKKKNKIK